MEKSLLPLLTYIIGMYDPYGVSHSTRVRDLAVKFIKLCGVGEHDQEMHDVELGALLHDIGKLGIPEAVRRQTGIFLPAERMLMEQHAVLGESILKQAVNGVITPQVCKIVRHHHEDWGGTGYPDGLKGDEIPFGSRVVRLCDSWDAATNVRGYRAALTPLNALKDFRDQQVMKPWADPALFRLFYEMMAGELEAGKVPGLQ